MLVIEPQSFCRLVAFPLPLRLFDAVSNCLPKWLYRLLSYLRKIWSMETNIRRCFRKCDNAHFPKRRQCLPWSVLQWLTKHLLNCSRCRCGSWCLIHSTYQAQYLLLIDRVAHQAYIAAVAAAVLAGGAPPADPDPFSETFCWCAFRAPECFWWAYIQKSLAYYTYWSWSCCS